MRRRELLTVAGGAALLRPLVAVGQPKVPVVGILVAGRPDPAPMLRLFRQGLRSLGYVEGQNIQLDIRNAEGEADRLPAFAADLVRAKVDVIAAWMVAVPVAKQATSEIPIVMLGYSDPVGDGTVASLARPGGNITGMAGETAELGGKKRRTAQGDVTGLDPHRRTLQCGDFVCETVLRSHRAGRHGPGRRNRAVHGHRWPAA